MKKVFLVGLLLVSWVCAKSVEQVQSEWQQKIGVKEMQENNIIQQSEEYQRLAPHCFQLNDKGACKKIINLYIDKCENGMVTACSMLTQTYLQGDEQVGVSIDEKKAQKYADKVCTMDALVCARMSGLFMYKDRKLALKYAEKACEMGELADCVMAAEFYAVGFGGVGKNPKKVKYYTDKLCKGGVSEACER